LIIHDNQKAGPPMKLIRFTSETSVDPEFGVVVRDHAVSFSALQRKYGRARPELTDSRSYLANLPESEQAAKELLAWGEEHLEELGRSASRLVRCACSSRSRSRRCSTSA
jgi:hypothetical protein